MRERVAVIIAAVVAGTILGGGAFTLLIGHTPASRVIAGHSLDYWIGALASEDTTLRTKAIDTVPRFGDEAVAPAVRQLDREKAQGAAIDALAGIASPAAVKALTDRLTSRRDDAAAVSSRSGALRALDRIGAAAASATPAAARLLDDDRAGPQAALFLSHVRPTAQAMEIVIDVALRGSSDWRKLDAIEVLAAAAVKDTSLEAALLRAARAGSTAVRAAATIAVCQLPKPSADAVPDMIALARQGDRRSLAAAKIGLAATGSGGIPEMAKALRDPSPLVRRAISAALGQMALSERRAVEPLLILADDADRDVCGPALTALDSLCAFDPLFQHAQLRGPSVPLRRVIARRAAHLADAEDLALMLDDADDEAQQTARSAVTELWDRSYSPLLAGLSSDFSDERARSVRLLPYLRGASGRIDRMLAAMDDPEPRVRLAAVGAIGRVLISPRLRDRLQTASENDDSWEVRAAAAQVLEQTSRPKK